MKDLTKVESLKAGKLVRVSGTVLESIRAMLCGQEASFWNFQPIGTSFEENGRVFLQPKSILGDEDGEAKLGAVARLLGLPYGKLAQLDILDIWDDR